MVMVDVNNNGYITIIIIVNLFFSYYYDYDYNSSYNFNFNLKFHRIFNFLRKLIIFMFYLIGLLNFMGNILKDL